MLTWSACHKAERINPYDELNNLKPGYWAPQNLAVLSLSITERKFAWDFGNHNIEGFKIDRKKGQEDWQEAYVSLPKETRSWNDNNIIPDPSLTYEYRVYAYAGSNISNKETISESAAIPAPSNLQITQNTITSVSLNWQCNSTGEEGFRIERKQGTGSWELLTTLTGISYTDEAFSLNTDVTYRIAAYYGQYASYYIESSFNSQIPPPENLTITANSASSVTLNWSYSLTGHEGFKIERKINSASWEVLVDHLNPNQRSFSENSLDLIEFEYNYRICAYYDQFLSNHIMQSAIYLYVGKLYAGGIIFYLDSVNGGLVCAESDQAISTGWGCRGKIVGETNTGIGTGAANTFRIIQNCNNSSIAAKVCNDLVLNGFDDWFLPSKDELYLMYYYLHLSGIGSFSNTYYWSSSEYNDIFAWQVRFLNGLQSFFNKDDLDNVRAVRAF